MAKWDSDKLDLLMKKAKEEKTTPAVPVRTLSKEETQRRYEKG